MFQLSRKSRGIAWVVFVNHPFHRIIESLVVLPPEKNRLETWERRDVFDIAQTVLTLQESAVLRLQRQRVCWVGWSLKGGKAFGMKYEVLDKLSRQKGLAIHSVAIPISSLWNLSFFKVQCLENYFSEIFYGMLFSVKPKAYVPSHAFFLK